MQKITFNSHISSSGILELQLPDELRNKDVTITISESSHSPETIGWPPGFFEQTYGSIPDLERYPQGEQVRDWS